MASNTKEKQTHRDNLILNLSSVVSSPSGSANSKENSTSKENEMRGQEHSFLMDKSDVEQMENGLLDLLEDFKKGKLHAFGGDTFLEQMNGVRDLQDKLAQLHFELEEEDITQRMTFSEDEQEIKSQQKQEQLMKNLENLCSSIQNLQQHDSD